MIHYAGNALPDMCLVGQLAMVRVLVSARRVLAHGKTLGSAGSASGGKKFV